MFLSIFLVLQNNFFSNAIAEPYYTYTIHLMYSFILCKQSNLCGRLQKIKITRILNLIDP